MGVQMCLIGYKLFKNGWMNAKVPTLSFRCLSGRSVVRFGFRQAAMVEPYQHSKVSIL